MSTRVVMPPAAAARGGPEALHSVRPGSLTCTWVSTSPGSRTSSPKSSRRAPGGTSASYGSTAAIRPSATATVAARVPSGVMTRVERNTSSTSDTRRPLSAAVNPAVNFHVTEFNVLLKESSPPSSYRQE